MPKRIQRKRTKGWKMPDGTIYVGRPTRWGNPYRWDEYRRHYSTPPGEVDDDPTLVPKSVRQGWAVMDFKSAIAYGIGYITGYPSHDEIRTALAGQDLACWCPLDQPCHADVLLEIANRGDA